MTGCDVLPKKRARCGCSSGEMTQIVPRTPAKLQIVDLCCCNWSGLAVVATQRSAFTWRNKTLACEHREYVLCAQMAPRGVYAL